MKDSTNTYKFIITDAILAIMKTYAKLNKVIIGDFNLTVNFVVDAWNLSIINDDKLIEIFIASKVNKLATKCNKTKQKIEDILYKLIKIKYQLYPDKYVYMNQYDIIPKENNDEPYLGVISSEEMPADYYANLCCNALLKQ